jgi:hypothetical protein
MTGGIRPRVPPGLNEVNRDTIIIRVSYMSSEVQQILVAVRALSLQEREELAAVLKEEALLRLNRPSRAAITAIRGKYAHVATSSEAFMARKHEDLSLEN